MDAFDGMHNIFIVFWAVIDPVGTLPVFIAITKKYEEEEKKNAPQRRDVRREGVLTLPLRPSRLCGAIGRAQQVISHRPSS